MVGFKRKLIKLKNSGWMNIAVWVLETTLWNTDVNSPDAWKGQVMNRRLYSGQGSKAGGWDELWCMFVLTFAVMWVDCSHPHGWPLARAPFVPWAREGARASTVLCLVVLIMLVTDCMTS